MRIRPIGHVAQAIVAVVLLVGGAVFLTKLSAIVIEGRSEHLYVQSTERFTSEMKVDIAQLAGCQSADACRSALSKALADNDAYLKWASTATVPAKLREAHTAYLRGANLHKEGAHQLLALWSHPPATQSQFDALLQPAADLLQRGDAATGLGDTLVAAAGLKAP